MAKKLVTLDRLGTFLDKVSGLIPTKVSQLTNDSAYITESALPTNATASTSGLTKLYTGTGTATDGTMTQAAITDLIGDVETALAAI